MESFLTVHSQMPSNTYSGSYYLAESDIELLLRYRQSRPDFRSKVRANPHKMYHRNDRDEEGKRPRSCRLTPSNSLSLRFQQKSGPNAPVALGNGSLNGISLANQSQNATNGELGELSQQFPCVLFYP